MATPPWLVGLPSSQKTYYYIATVRLLVRCLFNDHSDQGTSLPLYTLYIIYNQQSTDENWLHLIDCRHCYTSSSSSIPELDQTVPTGRCHFWCFVRMPQGTDADGIMSLELAV